jgi:Family of unknown function (DUF5906)
MWTNRLWRHSCFDVGAAPILQEDIAARHRGDFSPQKLQEARDRERAALQATNNQQIIAELMSCTSKRDVLNVMNKYHAYVIDGGKARIFREVNNNIQSLEIDAFRGWCANKSVPLTSTDPDGKTETKELKLYEFWYTHRDRFEYTGVDFNPSKTFNRNDRGIDVYDMWRNWETVAKKPETLAEKLAIKDVLRFIYEIICNRNMTHFYWVLSWVADLIQNPADPKGVALVLIGPKGIGKTFFGELVCYLVGDKYSFITANKNDIFGDFNGHLSNLMFVVYEEAVWAENRQIEAIQKVFISGKRRPSQAKYHDTKMVNNYIRSLLLANPGWAVPASLDERRYMILNPSVEKIKDHFYFGGLKSKLDSGALEALMYFLKKYRIGRGGVDVRSALKTDGLLDQQEASLEPFESWLLEEFLWTGVARCSGITADGSVMQINRNDMYEQYLDWCKKMDIRGRRLTPKKFGIKFGGYFPLYDANGNVQKAKNDRVISIFTGVDNTNSNGQHYYQFSSLEETRKIVCKKLGRIAFDWEGSGVNWEAQRNSAHLTLDAKMSTKDEGVIEGIIEGNIIPMRSK